MKLTPRVHSEEEHPRHKSYRHLSKPHMARTGPTIDYVPVQELKVDKSSGSIMSLQPPLPHTINGYHTVTSLSHSCKILLTPSLSVPATPIISQSVASERSKQPTSSSWQPPAVLGHSGMILCNRILTPRRCVKKIKEAELHKTWQAPDTEQLTPQLGTAHPQLSTPPRGPKGWRNGRQEQ